MSRTDGMPEYFLGTVRLLQDTSRAAVCVGMLGTRHFYLTLWWPCMGRGLVCAASQENICLQWWPYRTCLDRASVELAVLGSSARQIILANWYSVERLPYSRSISERLQAL